MICRHYLRRIFYKRSAFEEKTGLNDGEIANGNHEKTTEQKIIGLDLFSLLRIHDIQSHTRKTLTRHYFHLSGTQNDY